MSGAHPDSYAPHPNDSSESNSHAEPCADSPKDPNVDSPKIPPSSGIRENSKRRESNGDKSQTSQMDEIAKKKDAAQKDRVFCTGWSDDLVEQDSESIKENPWPLAQRAMDPDDALASGGDSNGSDEERTIRQAKIDRERIQTSAEREADQIQKDRSAMAAKIAELRDQLDSTPVPEWIPETEASPQKESKVSEPDGNEEDTEDGQVAANVVVTPEVNAEGSAHWGRILAAGPRIAAWAGGILTLLIAVIPYLIGFTSIPESRVQALLPPAFRGAVKIGSSSLSWFSPIVLNDVTVTGEENLPLGKIGAIELDRSLTGLCFGSNEDEMAVTLHEPDVMLLSAAETTNWEVAMADTLDVLPSNQSVRVRIRNGILRMVDLRECAGQTPQEVVVQGCSGEFVHSAQTQTSRLTLENAKIPIKVAAQNGGTETVEGSIRKIELAITPEVPEVESTEPGNVGPTGPQGGTGEPGVTGKETLRSGETPPGTSVPPGTSGVAQDVGGTPTPEYPVRYELLVDAPDVPLSLFSPFVGRWISGMVLDGVGGANVRAIWRRGPEEPVAIRMEGQLQGWETRLRCDPFGDDQPYFSEWTYTGTLEYHDGTLYCGDGTEPATLRWGWGWLSVDGAILLTAADRAVDHPEELFADMLTAGTSIRATIQVPEFLQNFATVLNVRDDVTAQSGTINLEMNGVRESAGIGCVGKLTTDDLQFVQNGQNFDFDKPMSVTFDAIRLADGVQLRNLAAKTEFCDLTASGNRRAFSAHVSFNFQTMQRELGKFLDLSGWTLSGDGMSKLEWKWKDDQTFSMRWETGVNDFVWSRSSGSGWSEQRLVLEATAEGTSDGSRGVLDKAALKLTVVNQNLSEEVYSIALAEPFDTSTDSPPSFKIAGKGSISRWVARLRGIDGVQLGGKFDGVMTLRVTKTAATNVDGTPLLDAENRAMVKNSFGIENLTVDLDDLTFRCDGEGGDFARWCGAWNIHGEKASRFGFTGTIYHDRRIQIQSANFLCWESVEGRSEGGANQLALVCGVDPERGMKIRQVGNVWTFDGKLLAGGDLNRLWRWRFTPMDGTASAQVYGSLDASLDCVVRTGTLVEPVLTASVKNFRVADAAGRVLYQDPLLSLSAQGAMNQTEGNLTIAEANLASRLLTADARGSLRRGQTDSNTGKTSPTQINLAGTVSRYDMNQIGAMVSSELGMTTSIQGSEQSSPFEVRLPLSREDAVLSGSFSWNAATIGGLVFGPATLRCRTPTPGTILIDPFEVTLNGGKLALNPTIQTSSWPMPDLTTTAMPIKEGGNFSMSLWNAVVPPVTEPVTTTTERVISLEPGSGPIADHIPFSSQSSQGLSLFLPTLAGSTAVTGAFSVYIDRAVIPLAKPSLADVWGWIEVHDLTVTSGNLLSVIQAVQSSGATIGQSRVVATIPEGNRTIPFRICRGRIAYLPTPTTITRQTLNAQGSTTGTTQTYTINTFGSVGFDRTLQLVIDMPLPTNWTSSEYFVHTALANQRIQVPLTGTLDQPILDRGALQEYWITFVNKGAENVITDQLNQLQEKFLGELGKLTKTQTSGVDTSGNSAITGLGLGATGNAGTGAGATGATGTSATGSDLLRNFLNQASRNLQQEIQNLPSQSPTPP